MYAAKTNGRRNRRPRMTAQEAQTFETYSESSIQQIIDAIDARREEGKHENCECEPYEDTFTFNRWIALGYGVKKGEKALKIQTFTPIESRKGETEETDVKEEYDTDRAKPRLRPIIACLFCRCQVTPKQNN